MFTVEQIKAAHAKVKSGADFPQYVQDLKQLGLVKYDLFVTDGHAVYFGENWYSTQSAANFGPLKIAEVGTIAALKNALSIHQKVETDYLTFCKQAAEAGVEKWTVDTEKMSCTYYDKIDNELVVEEIPAA